MAHRRVQASAQLNSAADDSVHSQVQIGPPITEKSEATERIRRAQRAIFFLSSQPSEVFLSGADPGHEVQFSRNRIVVHVSGPTITDLNFIDLLGSCLVCSSGKLSSQSLTFYPGLFVGGEETEINLIKNLATSCIKNPSCVILLTVACEGMSHLIYRTRYAADFRQPG
jgi:hypothetical protein